MNKWNNKNKPKPNVYRPISANTLSIHYSKLVAKYIGHFCEKEDMEFNGWVGDLIGEVAYINDYHLDFNDIRKSVDFEMPKGMIIEWHDQSVEYALENDCSDFRINLTTYFKGIKYENLGSYKEIRDTIDKWLKEPVPEQYKKNI